MQSDLSPAVNPAALAAAGNNSPLNLAVSVLSLLKSGWKTTEFWITLAGLLGVLIAGLVGALPADWAAVVTATMVAVYHSIRSSAKGAQHSLLADVVTAILENTIPAELHEGVVLAPAQALSSAPAEPHPAITGALSNITGLLGQIANASAASPEAAALPAASSQQPATATNIFPMAKPPGGADAFITPGLCIIVAALSALCICLFGGCTTTAKLQSNPGIVAAEHAAEQIALAAIGTELSGGTVNAAWAITQGLNSISQAVATMPNSQAVPLIRDTAIAFAGSKDATVARVADQLAVAFGQANPITPAERTAAVLALASGVTAALMPLPTK